MKKSRIVGFALTLASTLVVGSAMGQVRDASYTLFNAAAAAPDNVEYVSIKTTTGYYAEPDKAFHPNYNLAGGWATTTGFVWDWTITGGTKVATPSIADKNYVEIKWGNTAGDYTVDVIEQPSAAFGGCSNTSKTTINIKLIDLPTLNITTADNDGTGMCGNKTSVDVGLEATENVPNSLASFFFKYKVKIETIDGAGAVLNTIKDDPAGLYKAQTVTTTGNKHTFTVATGALDVKQDPTTNKLARTKYTFILEPNSLSSAITRKGDYILNSGKDDTKWTGYALGGTKTSVSFIVNPTPVTGPIFHIANNWAK